MEKSSLVFFLLLFWNVWPEACVCPRTLTRVNYSELLQGNFLLQSCFFFLRGVRVVKHRQCKCVKRDSVTKCILIFSLLWFHSSSEFVTFFTSERRTIMLASCRLRFSDFGKQIGYCRWILGRWQSSSTCARYQKPSKHFGKYPAR